MSLCSRSLFYEWVEEKIRWALKNFPQLKSPSPLGRDAALCPISDLMIPLSSGPGHEKERLEFAKEVLSDAPHDNFFCCLALDDRKHSSAFYAMMQQRTDLLLEILKYEKKW